ncbi:MAG TPA: galactose oxidase early set domain-containing protein [Planctomycetota bacterium]
MRSLAVIATLSLSVVVATLDAPLRAQGVWTVGFDHIPHDPTPVPPPGPQVHPASDSILNPSRWITVNPSTPSGPSPTPGQRMNTVHVCLIPSGVHRGEVLVLDGNLFNHPVRAFQPWSIVNPYWPQPNPNFWPGQPAVQYRFHNATLAMPPGQGELFCAGQCWMADGRLLMCGGTARYPFQTGGGFEGTKFVYLWDPLPDLTTGDPFGKWWQMADLEVPRWYPTVTYYGTAEHRAIVIGGTHWEPPPIGTYPVSSYEIVRPAFNVFPPQLQPPPGDFDRKLTSTTPPWSPSNPVLGASSRQYWGPTLLRFGDYPRIHTLGVLEPIGVGTAPRLFVSGFHAWGIRWAHDFAVDPVFDASSGHGFELGQMAPGEDVYVGYGTSLLLPGLPGGISSQVVRIGGLRYPPQPGPEVHSNRAETVTVNVSPPAPCRWLSTGPGLVPAMNHARFHGNVVLLPTGELFAIGGQSGPTSFNDTPELLVGGTTWVNMAPHTGIRHYHSAAILLPDGRVFVCGGEARMVTPIPGIFTGPPPGPDYLIWEPPYFHLSLGSVPAMGITVKNETTGLFVQQHLIGPSGMQYGQTYRADWANTLEPGISITSVVLMRPAALTHHDDGGQRMVRLNAWDDGTENSVVFQSPPSVLHAQDGWWMLFLVNSAGRPSQAYWVHLR